MDHREYIEHYLSADADDELTSAQSREVFAHLAQCAECREALDGERALKSIIREEFPILTAPEALRARISAGMDEIDRGSVRRRPVLRSRITWIAAAALAASLALVVVNIRGQAQDRLFDNAIASFERTHNSFNPNVGTRSVDELAVTLINQFGVALVWDFSSVGMAPVGGRVEHTADGKPVAYTMYKGGKDSLLCIIKREDVMPALSGGTVVRGIHVYRYKGFTIAATNRYSVFCVMVTNVPADEIARAFAKQPA